MSGLDICWILLRQEFDFIVRDQKECENYVENHLSRLEEGGRPRCELDINYSFQDEHVLAHCMTQSLGMMTSPTFLLVT